jgi:hypothetical protein
MRTQSMMTLAALAAIFLVTPAQAGLTVTNSTTGTSWATTDVAGNTIIGSTTTVADPTSGTVGQGLGVGNVLSQTFTTNTSVALGSLAIVASGAPGGVMSIHLFAMNSTYHPATDGGYVPATAFASADLFGGGSGLQFTYSGSGGSILNFGLTGVDQVALTANTTYAFELWDLNTSGLTWQRTSTDPYLGGSMFQATGGQTSNSTVTRGQVGGGNRDGMFTAYGVTPAPEPASLAALGLGALLLIRRRR